MAEKEAILEKLKILADAVPFQEGKELTAIVKPYPLFQGNFVMLEKGKLTQVTADNWREVNAKLLELLATSLNRKLGTDSVLWAVFLMVSSPYRIQFLDFIIDDITPAEIGEVLKWVWTDTEFPNQYPIPILVRLFEKADKATLMSKEDKEYYDKLPEIITIYRGTQSKKAKRLGMSWSLDKEKAVWFANRWKTLGGKVYKATIHKQYVYAYFNNRQEQEIVVNLNGLEGVTPLC